MAKLYEIAYAIEKCVKYPDGTGVDTETGEILDADAMDALNMEYADKMNGLIDWCINLQAEIENITPERDRLYTRQKYFEHRLESIKDYMSRNLLYKFKGAHRSLSKRKTAYVDVLDEGKIPEKYLKPQPAKVDKATILKELKAGETIPGTQLAERETLMMR